MLRLIFVELEGHLLRVTLENMFTPSNIVFVKTLQILTVLQVGWW